METNRPKRYDVAPLPRSRQTIVDLLKHVAGDTEECQMYADIEMTWVNALRKRLKAQGQNATVTAILLKAIAVAQTLHPESRTEMLPFGRQVTYNEIVAGFTLERVIDGQPTVFLGEIEKPLEKSLEEIGAHLKDHVDKPVNEVPPLFLQSIHSYLPGFIRWTIMEVGKRFPFLRLKCQKATFGLTSVGKWGVSSHTCPCLCACSISVGGVEDRAVVRNGEIVVRSMMTIGLNYDHRAIDSPTGARFVQSIVRLMEGDLEGWLAECGDETSAAQSASRTGGRRSLIESA